MATLGTTPNLFTLRNDGVMLTIAICDGEAILLFRRLFLITIEIYV